MEDIVEGKISQIAFGGKGVMRIEGMVVFVPYTAVGDVVKVSLTKKKKSFAEGTLLEVIQPSTDRISPKCPYYGSCGGCQLQHLSDSAQVKSKRQVIVDAFQRIGKISCKEEITLVPTSQQWAYRRHIRLTLWKNKASYQMGYMAANSSKLVKVDCCPIFIDEENLLLKELSRCVQALEAKNSAQKASLTLVKNGRGGVVIVFDFQGKTPSNLEVLVEDLLQKKTVVGAVIRAQGKTSDKLMGDLLCSMTVNGLEFDYSPTAFVQAHPQQSEKLYQYLVEIVSKTSVKRVLDLYCGVGVTSLLLAQKGCQGLGVEINAKAIEQARKNAKRHQFSHFRFLQADVSKIVKRLLKESFDLVVINPPRVGIDKQALAALSQHGPQHIVYISCMPSTLARDLKEFCDSGYQVRSCQAYEMFPQTAHVETVVHLERNPLK